MSEYFTGVTFPQQKVTPSYDAIIHRVTLSDGILRGCELSYSGYTLTMGAGVLIACGRQFVHQTVQNWAVSEATSGYARLLLSVDTTRASTKDNFDQIVDSIEYASDIDGFSDLLQTDINAAGTIYQMCVCVVSLGPGGITGIVKQLELQSAVPVKRGGTGANTPEGARSSLEVAQSIESETYPGCHYRVVDDAVEWINPPMVANEEYRTTERFNGKVVYRKLVSYTHSGQMGNSSSNTDFKIPHGISNVTKAVRCIATANIDAVYPYVGSTGGILQAIGFDQTNINVRAYKTYFNSPTLNFDLAYTKD